MDTFKLRGVGLFKELEMQARGKLVAAKVWCRCENKSWKIFINALTKSNCNSLSKKNDDMVPVVSLVWWSGTCSDDNQEKLGQYKP